MLYGNCCCYGSIFFFFLKINDFISFYLKLLINKYEDVCLLKYSKG